MGKLKNGILGGFSGKVGSVVGYIINDEHFIRAKPRDKKYTKNERINQAKFKLVTDYLSPIKYLLKIGFKDYFTKSGGYRAAMSYTRKVALVSDEKKFEIDPALFKISGGNLPELANPVLTMEGGKCEVKWDTSEVNSDTAFDQIILLIYDSTNFNAQMIGYNGPNRRQGILNVPIKKIFKNKMVNVYIGFIAGDRSGQSNSQFLGSVMVTM
jgi:hypothetical protein